MKRVNLMKILLYLILALYIISPFDLIPDFLVGLGWLDDLILGGLFWYYFIYLPSRNRAESEKVYYQEKAGSRSEGYRENQKEFQTDANFSKFDPYKVLNVHKGASLEEIKKAYRKLVPKYHPDRVIHLGDEFRSLAEQKFKEIQKAYKELINKYSERK